MKPHFLDKLITGCMIIFTTNSCTPSRLEEVLELSGSNREQLEKVLQQHSSPADSLKLQAALFLIENMPGHYTLQGDKIDRFRQVIDRDSACSYYYRKLYDITLEHFIIEDKNMFHEKDVEQEYGGVVMINTKENNSGNLYRFEPHVGKPTPYSASSVTVDMSFTESNYGPHRGGEFAVLLFHTHPPYWEYKGDNSYQRRTGPSDPDIESHTTLPAVVKDFQHPTGLINSLMSKSEYVNTEELYFYGIDRRIN